MYSSAYVENYKMEEQARKQAQILALEDEIRHIHKSDGKYKRAQDKQKELESKTMQLLDEKYYLEKNMNGIINEPENKIIRLKSELKTVYNDVDSVDSKILNMK